MAEALAQLLIILQQVEDKIAAGEVDRALQLLRETPGFPDPEKEIIQLLARWNAAERDMLESLMAEDDFKVERAQITKRFIQVVDEARQKVQGELDSLKNGSAPVGEGAMPALPHYDGRPQILLLYALEDRNVLEELQRHLFLALRDEELQFVDIHVDVPMLVTTKLDYQKQMLGAARTVLVLVTPNAFSLPVFDLAAEALEMGKLIPIRVEEVDLTGTPFHHDIKGLPNDGRFVSEWPNRNSAWVDIARSLHLFFNRLKEEQQ